MDTLLDHPPLTEGRWWRFSAYEVRDGWIRPAVDARLETFDPWGEHRAAWDAQEAIDLRMKRTTSPPYQRLFDLIDSLGAGAFANPTDEDARAITGWCQEFGLLGLLSHRVVAATFRPRWCNDPNIRRIVPATTSWLRKTSGWQTSIVPHWLIDGRTVTGQERDVGRFVDSELLPKNASPAGVHLRKSPSSFDVEFHSVGDGLKNYFPAVAAGDREGYEYPLPLSEPFWTEYGERLSEFLSCASALKRAVTALSDGPFTEESAPEKLTDAVHARDALVALASGTGQYLSFRDNGALGQSWVSTSLLSSLATMALQDLAEGRVRRCEAHGCGKPFASFAYQAIYCSKRCRERETKARYRAGKKTKEQEPKRRDRNGKEAR